MLILPPIRESQSTAATATVSRDESNRSLPIHAPEHMNKTTFVIDGHSVNRLLVDCDEQRRQHERFRIVVCRVVLSTLARDVRVGGLASSLIRPMRKALHRSGPDSRWTRRRLRGGSVRHTNRNGHRRQSICESQSTAATATFGRDNSDLSFRIRAPEPSITTTVAIDGPSVKGCWLTVSGNNIDKYGLYG